MDMERFLLGDVDGVLEVRVYPHHRAMMRALAVHRKKYPGSLKYRPGCIALAVCRNVDRLIWEDCNTGERFNVKVQDYGRKPKLLTNTMVSRD